MKKILKALIIEDSTNAYLSLKGKLETIGYIHIVGWEKTIKKSIVSIQKKEPDIVFMDIELEDGFAFDILDSINSENFDVIFTTAFNTYYEAAFRYYAFNYLLKPIHIEDLRGLINRYRKIAAPRFSKTKYDQINYFLQEENSRILLKYGHDYIFKNLNEIRTCKAEGNYTKFYFSDGSSLLVSYTLRYYVDLLEPKGFFRANRSYLLNIQYMKSVYRKEYIIMKYGERVKISPKYKDALIKIIDALT